MANEPIEHLFSAALRVFGQGIDFDEIERELGLIGVRDLGRASEWSNDMWSYEAPVERERPAVEHIDTLWAALRGHAAFLRKLKERPGYTVDVYLSYYSNWPDGGIVVPTRSLEMFTELQVAFGLSIIVAGSAGRRLQPGSG